MTTALAQERKQFPFTKGLENLIKKQNRRGASSEKIINTSLARSVQFN